MGFSCHKNRGDIMYENINTMKEMKDLLDVFSNLGPELKSKVRLNIEEWLSTHYRLKTVFLPKYNTIQSLIPMGYIKEIVQNRDRFSDVSFQSFYALTMDHIYRSIELFNDSDNTIKSTILELLLDLMNSKCLERNDIVSVLDKCLKILNILSVNKIETRHGLSMYKEIADLLFQHIIPYKFKGYSTNNKITSDCRPVSDMEWIVSYDWAQILLRWIRNITIVGSHDPYKVNLYVKYFSLAIILICKGFNINPCKYCTVFIAWSDFEDAVKSTIDKTHNLKDLIKLIEMVQGNNEESSSILYKEIDILLKQKYNQFHVNVESLKRFVDDLNHYNIHIESNLDLYNDFDYFFDEGQISEFVRVLNSYDIDLIKSYFKTKPGKINFTLPERLVMGLKYISTENRNGIIATYLYPTDKGYDMKYLWFLKKDDGTKSTKRNFNAYLLFDVGNNETIYGIEITNKEEKKITSITIDKNIFYEMTCDFSELYKNVLNGGD